MNTRKFRVETGLVLLFVVPAGFATKGFHGPLAHWMGDYGGALIYEIFWCLAAAFLLPRARAWRIAAWVFSVTCILECLQLWHPPFLEAFRSGFAGRTLIGVAFKWSDFPYYFIGSAAGGGAVRLLQKRSTRRDPPDAPQEGA